MRTHAAWAVPLLVLGPAWAELPAPPTAPVGGPGSRVEHYRVEYRVNKDGSNTRTYDLATLVLHERALPALRQVELSHSTSIEKLEILEAFVGKADGVRVDVPKEGQQLQVGEGRDGAARAFADRTSLTLAFPELEVGDTVALRYRITQVEPTFPGHFSVRDVFSSSIPYGEVVVTVNAPKGMQGRHGANGMKEKISDEKDRHIVEWRWANPEPEASRRRDYSVYDPDQEVGYAYSTFGSYAEIARAYGEGAQRKAKPSTRVKRLARSIVEESTDPRERVQKVYEWVTRNIGVAGTCLDTGVVVPRDLDFVIDNRLGDCKDHATLVQALLAALEIESTQALVNSGNIYRLPKVADLSTLNHVINYVPSLELFLDTTSTTTPFGLLPFGVADKDVALVGGDGELRTPAIGQGTNRQHMKTVAEIAPDGVIAAEIDLELHGAFAAEMRAWMRDVPKEKMRGFVNEALAAAGHAGRGSLKQDDPAALRDEHKLRLHLRLDDYLPAPPGAGAGTVAIRPLWRSVAPIHSYVRSALKPLEKVDVACSNGTSSEEYVLTFPENLEIVQVPEDFSLSNDFVSYRATYRLDGRQLHVVRTLDDRTPGNVCAPELMAAYQEFARKVLPNLEAPVFYQ